MKIAHTVKISVFIYQTDNALAIEDAFRKLFPFNIEDEKLSISRSVATGFNEKKITILELMLLKETHTSKFLSNLKDKLSLDQKVLLVRQLDSRLHDDLGFYLRLDKPRLLDGVYWITDSGDCFHIKVTVAAFPSNKEVAAKVIHSWLS